MWRQGVGWKEQAQEGREEERDGEREVPQLRHARAKERKILANPMNWQCNELIGNSS
jgi:hypothetical protein